MVEEIFRDMNFDCKLDDRKSLFPGNSELVGPVFRKGSRKRVVAEVEQDRGNSSFFDICSCESEMMISFGQH